MGRKDSPTITARFGGGSMSTTTHHWWVFSCPPAGGNLRVMLLVKKAKRKVGRKLLGLATVALITYNVFIS